MVSNLNDLKKHIFFDMLELAARVFIVVRYSDRVVIGNRGFLPEEKEKGIVLVFNRMMNFEWSESGISATLGFGTKTEKCFIPPDEIIAVFSPELSAQFIVSQEGQTKTEPEIIQAHAEKYSENQKSKNRNVGQKVVKIDFTKKK